ncbi:GNAT family acetyltransferase [Ramlibacter sp. H39-3-26]|uniref:GNAT family acetyltransferase n=1 Tax=Curvibacter soli TaxID=3031331 RepID=UPI0023DA15F4|nr:GNAT family acetyltransferase [Ramlibacter sp. H39-3-26]MDF1486202.1 GNAT family acetyltransferase [Ramlibacter sp. H39-3-26]
MMPAGATAAVRLRPFAPQDTQQVVALWRACGLVRPWNDPYRDIARKQAEQPELFLVAQPCDGGGSGQVAGSAMAGYDGHRGWVYYLAVAPGRQRLSIGRALMAEAERLLLARGCPKINLQVRSGNQGVLAFYEKLGYARDDTISLGKRLIPDA